MSRLGIVKTARRNYHAVCGNNPHETASCFFSIELKTCPRWNQSLIDKMARLQTEARGLTHETRIIELLERLACLARTRKDPRRFTTTSASIRHARYQKSNMFSYSYAPTFSAIACLKSRKHALQNGSFDHIVRILIGLWESDEALYSLYDRPLPYPCSSFSSPGLQGLHREKKTILQRPNFAWGATLALFSSNPELAFVLTGNKKNVYSSACMHTCEYLNAI